MCPVRRDEGVYLGGVARVERRGLDVVHPALTGREEARHIGFSRKVTVVTVDHGG
jgi:hypothetical protein